MITKCLLATFILLTVFNTKEAWAHPVAFAGSSSIMTWNSKEMSDWMFIHSLTYRYALGARYLRLETKEGERIFYIPQLNFLLKRWNELDSQANIYLSLGHGREKGVSGTSLASLESDWESRKYYISFKEDVLISHKDSKKNIYQSRLRAGFAPYLAEFNEINSWFILQLDRSNKVDEEYQLTPIIRLFYHNVLLELGVNSRGSSQFNFMVHF